MAVGLLGAVTHQAFSRAPGHRSAAHSFVSRYRGVGAVGFAEAVVVLFVLTSVGGSFLYPQYRLDVRPALEEMQLRAANGVFEIKEHFAAIGLGVLPAYWVSWRPPLLPEHALTRRWLTGILAFVTWWSFLVGHVLNNLKGLNP